MAFFDGSEQFYACTQALFDQVQEQYPAAGDDISKAKLIIRLKCLNPEAQILINGRHNPPSYVLGENRVRPTIDIVLETDTLHQILLGELRLSKALSTRALTVSGPAHKTLILADLFHQLQALYPMILREQGLGHK